MSIYYKELLIVDKARKTARKFIFNAGINIITSKENSVGKTSLSLMLLYGFGAKVKFSDKWDIENIFTKLSIEKDGTPISITRYKDTYTILSNGERFSYPIQKQGYSDKLYELLGLTIKIKDKNSDTYSTAVPSLYLLPYFLSQTKADDDRSVFLDLNMYAKKDLYDAMYYHVGALDNDYTSVILELTKNKIALEKLKKEKEDQFAEIEYLEKKLEENKSVKAIEAEEDLKADISSYEKYAENNQKYYDLVRREAELKRAIKLLQKAIADNALYSNKLLNQEEIRCPVCKSDITDFLSSALNLGMAEDDLTVEIASLKAELLETQRKIALLKPKLAELRQQISRIEESRENVRITRAILVWNEELKKVKDKFANTQLEIEAYEKLIQKLSIKQRTYSERKKSADARYRMAFSFLLDATNVSKHELDLQNLSLYESVNLSGSEIPRVAIAKFFALLESKSTDSIVMPIIFDFPNIDMTEGNILRCFKIMCERIKDTEKYPQSFVFSINCEERIADTGCILENTHIIDMAQLSVDDPNNPRLLCKQDFITYSKEINEMLQ